MSNAPEIRRQLAARIDAGRERLIATCQTLVRTPSENPPGDTRAIADQAVTLLADVPGCEIERVTGREPFVNLVARVKGARPGRRLVFNGHLDTFAVGDRSLWTVDPLGGTVKDGRVYGRGVSDMKGGMAASIMAFRLLAECRDAWAGEAVLTLAADEETMGQWGTAYLLKTVPHASGEAMICGDAGSPMVIRFGEKGLLWLELNAVGRAAHGAHVHLGDNALDRLMEAVRRVQTLRELAVDAPPAVVEAMRQAKPVSEAISGAGEAAVLGGVTVNLGTLGGGDKINLVPAAATASLDIRLPVGVSIDAVLKRIEALLSPLPGVTWKVLGRYEPNFTDPRHELFALMVEHGAAVLGKPPVVNMRVGASDSRLYRLHGVPSAVYGPTPHNMGGPDEHITLADLHAVFYVHALTAFDFLAAARPG